MTALPIAAPPDCWNQIGVWGDRTCPELQKVVHCHNCPVFARAGRRFLHTPAADDYVAEWTQRLAAPVSEAVLDLQSVLAFRIGVEWLALPVQVLIEVTHPRPIHRMPHRGGVLAGLVNVRGELCLCVHLDQILGIATTPEANGTGHPGRRLLVVQRDGDRWVFPVEEVDQVHRFPTSELTAAPATVTRAAGRMTRGVFALQARSIGYLDDARLFQSLRTRLR